MFYRAVSDDIYFCQTQLFMESIILLSFGSTSITLLCLPYLNNQL